MHDVKIPARSRVAALAALVTLSLTGCAAEERPTAPAVEEPPTATVTPTPASTPTVSAVPTLMPSPTATPPAVAAMTLKQRLLPTSSVPGLNARWVWQTGKTRSAGTQPFGICAPVDLASIGATQVIERTYFPPDDSDDSAAQQVAAFTDAKSTEQAWSVLGSWRASCGQRVSADIGLKAQPLIPITVAAGQARWYLVSWEPIGEETGRFEAFGMVRDGTTISVLRMTSSGQDYNYPAGKEPMVAMARNAADLLAQ